VSRLEDRKSWCENSAADALSNNCSGEELTRRGLKSITARLGNGLRGIGLKPEAVQLKVA
jgi:hypothetical protein